VERGWRFRRRQGACARCGSTFVDGEALFSLLRLEEGGVLERGDLCSRCFDARDPGQDVFWWRTAHRQRRRVLALDFELLLGLVEQLAGDAREPCRDLAFLLALLLVRHRRLRLSGVRRSGGGEELLLRRPRSTRSFPVEVRELAEEPRRLAQAALAALLDPDEEAAPEELLQRLAEARPGEPEAAGAEPGGAEGGTGVGEAAGAAGGPPQAGGELAPDPGAVPGQ